MDKVCQTDTGIDQQPQPGAADIATTEPDWGQPQALQTGGGEAGLNERVLKKQWDIWRKGLLKTEGVKT